MTTYRVHAERHFEPAMRSGPYNVPPRDFAFSVRRNDGTLVFRADTDRFARELLTRLYMNCGRAAS